jgi:hypothetical protein
VPDLVKCRRTFCENNRLTNQRGDRPSSCETAKTIQAAIVLHEQGSARILEMLITIDHQSPSILPAALVARVGLNHFPVASSYDESIAPANVIAAPSSRRIRQIKGLLHSNIIRLLCDLDGCSLEMCMLSPAPVSSRSRAPLTRCKVRHTAPLSSAGSRSFVDDRNTRALPVLTVTMARALYATLPDLARDVVAIGRAEPLSRGSGWF